MDPVPDNNEAIYVRDKDKGQPYNIVEMLMKHETFADSLKGNLAYMAASYMKNAAISMLNDRLKEYAEKPESPFLQASASFGPYLLSRSVDAFEMGILPKDGQAEAAVTAVLTEVRRAAEFGFTPTEYNRFKANYLSNLDKQYSNKDKRYNRQFVTSLRAALPEQRAYPQHRLHLSDHEAGGAHAAYRRCNMVMKELVCPYRHQSGGAELQQREGGSRLSYRGGTEACYRCRT